MSYQEIFLKTAKSNSKTKPKPQIIIKNPLAKPIFVNAINLVCDIYFSLKGRCEIKINNNPEFTPDADAFKLRKELLLPLEEQILEQNGKIEITVWNESDDNDVVELSAQIIISEHPRNIVLSGQAVDDSTMLQGISGGAGDKSDTHDIFPYKIYRDETKKFLINTKGRQNMLLTMAASNVLAPVVIANNFSILPLPEITIPSLTFDVDDTPDDDLIETSSSSSSSSGGGRYQTPTTRTDTTTQYQSIRGYDFTNVQLPSLPDSYDSWIDSYIVIDGHNNSLKTINFNFSNSVFVLSQNFNLGKLTQFIKRRSRSTTRVRYSTSDSVRYTLRSDVTTPYPAWGGWAITRDTPTSYQIHFEYKIKIKIDACDSLDFQNDVSELIEFSSNGQKTTTTTKKYIRLRRIIQPIQPVITAGSGGDNYQSITTSYPTQSDKMTVTGLIDSRSHGGTAKLYFQLKGVNNHWFVLLPSAKLDSITQGDSKLIQFSVAGIPPSQSRFEAVLQVVGSLKTGVTIDLVA